MKLNELKIGYVPYGILQFCNLLEMPGDRRRFCFYARKRNITFEIADLEKQYDLIIVTQGADLSVLSKYDKGQAKIIYEPIDSYLSISKTNIKGWLRGGVKYITGQSRHLQLNYWKAIEDMCRNSDAIICSTEEQKKLTSPFCSNVHIILDDHSMYNTTKKDYSAGEAFNLVWEGYGPQLEAFSEINEVLIQLKKKYKIALHLVVGNYWLELGRFRKRNSLDLVQKVFKFDDVHVYQWNELTCSKIVTSCDLALVPIRLNHAVDCGKPEDKLLVFWHMGMPALVSATPSHMRAMEECGQSLAFLTQEEWYSALEKYINDEEARREAGLKGKKYAEIANGEEVLLSQWDKAIKSLFPDLSL